MGRTGITVSIQKLPGIGSDHSNTTGVYLTKNHFIKRLTELLLFARKKIKIERLSCKKIQH